MELVVFGASGRVGRRLCTIARGDGHHVRAFVRDAARAPAGVDVVEDDVTDADGVATAVTGTDAVCSALGPTADDDTDIVVEGAGTIVAGMESAGVDRLVAVAASGILQATPGRLRLDTDEFPRRFEQVATAHRAVYERLSESTLDWTLACPPRMPDGPPTDHYRIAVDYLPEGGQSISTGDVAAFVYETLLEDRHVNERVGLAY